MPPKYFVKKWDDVTASPHPEDPYFGTTFKLIGRDLGAKYFVLNMTIMKPGEKIPIHSHPTAEEVHVLLSGKSTLTVEGKKVKAEAITAFRFPPGLHYGLVNDSKKDATWMFVAAPTDEYDALYAKKFGDKKK